MKKLFLTWSAASLLALFYAACGDDVIHVHNDEYAIVDSLDSLACSSENEGEMALVKSPASFMFVPMAHGLLSTLPMPWTSDASPSR